MITTQGVTGHAIVQPPEAFETTNSRRPDGRVHGIDESRRSPPRLIPPHQRGAGPTRRRVHRNSLRTDTA